MNIPRPVLLAIALVGALVLIGVLQQYGSLLMLMLGGLLLVLVPLALAAGAAFVVVRHVRASPPAPARPASPPAPAGPPLVQALQRAFQRSQDAQLDRILAGLPTWPITPQIRATARDLLALKRSIYRAQAEGVPAPLIQRYLANLDRATATVWTLASTVDALGQQPVAYALVAGRLDQEAQGLVQLQQSVQAAQHGIAQLLLLRMQPDALRQVETDLFALTGAIQQLVERID